MFITFPSKLIEIFWIKFIPLFVARGAGTENPYDYYVVYFVDVSRQRYRLTGIAENKGVIVEKWFSEFHHWSEKVTLRIPQLDEMAVQIIHYRKQGFLSFSSIVLFTFSYYTRFSYVKNSISRTKGCFTSVLFAKKEIKSRDRIALLNLMLNEYVRQKPAQVHTGVTTEEIIELLYGLLWYKHIRNEEFSRKITLILQSLVITGDLKLDEGRYFVQGKAITTMVEYEKEEKRSKQQIKIQKNIVRLMLVITLSTVMITLAILAQAGIVNLQRLWEYILHLKPLRILLKLI